ncbi:YjzC family protein [Floricoccus tropicus]|uniref:YjzC family protein n=1 Tax=Floricoccus tropicus TaxID=1859473 RepID=A0A1E8GLM6_9LACT|nr:YjzC family protein [Floricoccus tropicus]OFI48896.1 YjzC family protein [Floricoccus tropicus]
MTPHKSGTDNLPAGKYIEVGPNGEKLEKEHIISIDRGDRLPPVKKAGNGWFRM